MMGGAAAAVVVDGVSGVSGECRLSAAMDLLMPLVSMEEVLWKLALSASGVGGQVPGEVVQSWVGWEDKGPPPGVGGRDKRGLLFWLLPPLPLDGGRDGGGLSSGAGTEQSRGSRCTERT